jgi:hypothetical protein
MNKKSAMLLAGGLAAALLSGLVALSINMGILSAAGTPKGPGKLTSKPIVRTEVETITHKPKASTGSAPVETVVVRRHGTGSSYTSNPTASRSSGGYESEPEHEFGENDDD